MPVLGLHHAQVFCPPGGEAQARRFYVGLLGMAKVAVLKSKEVAEDVSPMWDVLLQEASSEPRRKPETKEAAQPEAAAAPYSAKRLEDDAIPF